MSPAVTTGCEEVDGKVFGGTGQVPPFPLRSKGGYQPDTRVTGRPQTRRERVGREHGPFFQESLPTPSAPSPAAPWCGLTGEGKKPGGPQPFAKSCGRPKQRRKAMYHNKRRWGLSPVGSAEELADVLTGDSRPLCS